LLVGDTSIRMQWFYIFTLQLFSFAAELEFNCKRDVHNEFEGKGHPDKELGVGAMKTLLTSLDRPAQGVPLFRDVAEFLLAFVARGPESAPRCGMLEVLHWKDSSTHWNNASVGNGWKDTDEIWRRSLKGMMNLIGGGPNQQESDATLCMLIQRYIRTVAARALSEKIMSGESLWTLMEEADRQRHKVEMFVDTADVEAALDPASTMFDVESALGQASPMSNVETRSLRL